MVTSPLPNREHRHLLQFYLAPKMDYSVRLAVAGALILAGVALQLFLPTQSLIILLIASVPLILAGNLFLLARGFNLRPTQRMHGGEWEKTTRDRFTKMRQLEREVKNWDESFTDLTCTSGIVALVVIALGVAGVWVWLNNSYTLRFWAPLFVADAATLLLPHWLTGTRRGWRPVALQQTIAALDTAMTTIDQFNAPPCQVQPMFEMSGKGEKKLPINARVFVRFPDEPSEFLGIQFQVAMNNVQGTNYPYLYAVLVAKKEFQLLSKHLPAVKQKVAASSAGSKLVVESSREDDVEVIIIRQRTSKTSGYHTKKPAIRNTALAAWWSVETVLR